MCPPLVPGGRSNQADPSPQGNLIPATLPNHSKHLTPVSLPYSLRLCLNMIGSFPVLFTKPHHLNLSFFPGMKLWYHQPGHLNQFWVGIHFVYAEYSNTLPLVIYVDNSKKGKSLMGF